MQTKLDAFIDRVQHLPPSPRLLVKLLELFKHPDPDINEVVGLISHDPAFTVEVLKRCNSAFIGTEKPAEDMFEAVSRLGFQEIYEIVLAMFAAAALLPPGARDGVHVEMLCGGIRWRSPRSRRGCWPRKPGNRSPPPSSRGLLHDIGKVVKVVSAQRDRITRRRS